MDIGYEREQAESAPQRVHDQMLMLYEAETLYSAPPDTADPKLMSGPDPARKELYSKYADRLTDRREYGPLCTYVPNKRTPIFRWFKYKEGFSRALVQRLVSDEWRLPESSSIFDPFAGSGTTLLACQQLGFPSVGVEVMPVSVFVSKVKLFHDYDLVELARATRQLLDSPRVARSLKLPDVKIIRLAFTPDVHDAIVCLRETIRDMSHISEATRNFLLLGLLSILEEVSSTSKDGQFLRLVERPIPPVIDALGRRLCEMMDDLRLAEIGASAIDHVAPAEVIQGDARALPLGPEFDSSFDGVITSPPYLNRYDYSRTYSLELLLLFADDFAALKDIRHSLLRSHIESRPAPTDDVSMPALKEILDNIAPKRLNNPRIPIMIKGYFEDMNLVIRELHRVTRPSARVALVVANARFEGELTPVDMMLSELAESAGFETEAIWTTRYKGNSSQQMGRYGRVPVRESIVIWRKR
jgi:DNA modification methylase